VRAIRIYVEGGGNGKGTKAALRMGFQGFLKEFWEAARDRKFKLDIIACGDRRATEKGFEIARSKRPRAFSILLTDSDGPLAPQCTRDRQRHFMVQIMESWLIADPAALEDFYGQGFNANPVPSRRDVEAIDKGTVLSALERATERTQKGKYHKTKHAPKLLKRVDPKVVCSRAPYCDRLFRILDERLKSTP